ncbi:uncharacterized protein [Henckelia pumila]|uniref:uncharacterized protein n=1 Tax=Henckelia pumila TaxID=405737 RepID=UPI003C6E4932
MLRDKNPGITIGLKCDGLDVKNLCSRAIFQRLFVSFPAQKIGFVDGCRPFIGIDGCFLKGPYGGQLLVAVALDANFGIFLLAIMFAEVESEDSWGYFFTIFNQHIGDGRHLTFMSDKKKGILKALKNIHPEDSSRYCARHRYINFRKLYPGPKLKGLYWDAVRATNEIDFKHAMDFIKSVNEDAWKWLLQDEPKHWSLHAFDHHVKVDHVTNNMTESFNAWLEKSRQLPVLTLLEYIRRKVMKRIHGRFEKGNAWESEIPPMMTES